MRRCMYHMLGLLVFGFIGLGLMAQTTQRSAATTDAYVQMRAQKGNTTMSVAEKMDLKVQMQLQEMHTYRHDAAYDMQAALTKLRQLGVMYPLQSFDPSFPIIRETGDKQADKARLQEALRAWKGRE